MRRLKLFLGIFGFLLAAAGIGLDNQPLIWAAMTVLAAALALRFWLRRNS